MHKKPPITKSILGNGNSNFTSEHFKPIKNTLNKFSLIINDNPIKNSLNESSISIWKNNQSNEEKRVVTDQIKRLKTLKNNFFDEKHNSQFDNKENFKLNEILDNSKEKIKNKGKIDKIHKLLTRKQKTIRKLQSLDCEKIDEKVISPLPISKKKKSNQICCFSFFNS